MRDIKSLGKYCAPVGCRKEEEAQRLNLDDAPNATKLRSRDKQVDASQTKQNGVTASKNPTDKKGQNLTHKSNRSEVHSSSSSRTRQNRSPSKNYEHREKQVIANKRFAQPKTQANNNNASSSSHQVRRDQKMKNVRLSSEESSEDRPLEDPYDLPVVEPHPCYIRSEGSERQGVGWTCGLCKKDVGVSACEEEEEEEEEDDSYLYPEVSVLPCGHVYHSSCLLFQFRAQDLIDGDCIFCLKLLP